MTPEELAKKALAPVWAPQCVTEAVIGAIRAYGLQEREAELYRCANIARMHSEVAANSILAGAKAIRARDQ